MPGRISFASLITCIGLIFTLSGVAGSGGVGELGPTIVLSRKNQHARRPAETPRAVLQTTVRVVNGSVTIVYEVLESGNWGDLRRFTHGSAMKRKHLEDSDLEFFHLKVLRLPKRLNEKSKCAQNYLEMKSGGKSIIGCLNRSDSAHASIQSLAQFLESSFR